VTGGGSASAKQAASGTVAFGYATSSPVDGLVYERLLNPKFFTHFERFNKRPALNATLVPTNLDPTQAEVAAILAANLDLEIAGVNADDAGVEFLEGGGIRMETVGADGDEHILQAHTDTNQSSLAACNWDSRNRPLFMANILTGPEAADIDNCILWMGWKLTSAEAVATDADQAYFRYENGVNGGRWQAITEADSVNDSHDTGILVNSGTLYRLIVDVGPDRVPRYYINNRLVETGPALRALATFDFFIGVASDGAAEAKELDIRNFMVSQLYG
jgi:hypothetical protein